MSSVPFEVPHLLPPMAQRLRHVALALDLFAVSAFLTDPCNRFLWVNQSFTRMVGDPIRDRLPTNMRFVPAAMLGPYHERFPEAKPQIVQCLPGLAHEVAAGRLAAGTLGLVHGMLAQDAALRRAVEHTTRAWDGTIVVKSSGGKRVLVHEQVIPVTDAYGNDSGFHVSLWLPLEHEPPLVLVGPQDCPEAVTATLTPRQLQLARWYAAGLTSRDVAIRAGISLRTARAHLEHIYTRLSVHSRAELTLVLVREGLV
jgi:DNA-binding CsgD family transcriptional regulator